MPEYFSKLQPLFCLICHIHGVDVVQRVIHVPRSEILPAAFDRRAVGEGFMDEFRYGDAGVAGREVIE